MPAMPDGEIPGPRKASPADEYATLAEALQSARSLVDTDLPATVEKARASLDLAEAGLKQGDSGETPCAAELERLRQVLDEYGSLLEEFRQAQELVETMAAQARTRADILHWHEGTAAHAASPGYPAGLKRKSRPKSADIRDLRLRGR